MKISRRHTRSIIKTRVARSVKAVSPEAWNSVFPDVIESYYFFKTLEESNLDQFSLYYVLAYKNRALVGIAPCFLMNYSLDTSINGPLRRVSNTIKSILPNIFTLRAFVCGSPLGQCRLGISGERDEIFRALRRRIEQVAKKNKAQIVAFKDFDASHTPLLDSLQKTGYSKFESLPNTELNITFKNFDEYMMTLSAASRYDLRRKFKKVDGSVDIRMEIVNSLPESVLTEVYRLYLSMIEKHEMDFEILPIDFFKNISKNMPEETKYFLWWIDGKLVVFLLALVSKDYFIDYYLGLDYTAAHKYHLYFIKFRDALNWCIQNNIKTYEMGFTGYEPKKRLGFQFVPMYLYVKHRNKVIRPLFKLLCNFLKFENFDPVLKKAKQERKHEKAAPHSKNISTHRTQ